MASQELFGRKLRVLFFAPLPPPVGGAALASELLISELQTRNNLSIKVVDLSREHINVFSNSRVIMRVIMHLLREGSSSDVITFHANSRARILVGPFVFLLTRLLGKPIIMRAFGGSFDRQYERLPGFLKFWMRRTYLQSNICLLESHEMVRYFSTKGTRRPEWFSNYTRSTGLGDDTPYKKRCDRLVFLGRIVKEKGVDIILQSISNLTANVTIDLYGPLADDYSAEMLEKQGKGRLAYGGVLSPEQIVARLWEYDALVLPTYWHGEGYPAVVLEAYAHGIPVITTNWLVLGEIVDDTCGILIEPRRSDQLAEAINRLHSDQSLYRLLQEGARKKVTQFSVSVWAERFEQFCFDVTG